MRFQVLGPVAAYGERGPVALGPARQRTVLAALLIEPGTAVSFDQLIERVWGDRPPRRTRGTLHSYLSRLRTVLSEAAGPTLVRQSQHYLLVLAPEAVDLYRFRVTAQEARRATDDGRAATLWGEAFALWHGAPLADLDSDWARAVAAGLTGERLVATLDHNDVLLRRGDHARLLPLLAADAAAHPLDERLAGQLMLALYRCGRQADAVAHYRSLMGRLADELGSDPGPPLQQLYQRLSGHDPTTTATVDRAAATKVAAARPAQLPADIAGFTGRAELLRRLDTLLGPADEPSSTAMVTAIGGTAGIGKTTLAVHWAHKVRERFPDGQLYLNLRGFDPGGQATGPAEALRSLLELLGVPPAQVPSSVEAQTALYRRRLAGTRTLVLLDNARSADQVRPLLPGAAGSMALVTSRNQLTDLAVTDGARLVRLDVLNDVEARQLLVHRLGADRVATQPDAADGIVAACAGLPLALAIVAARAAAHPRFPLSAFAEELADVRGRLDALAGPDAATDARAVFSWSYDALAPPTARLFRLLGLHPGPDIGLPAAASLAGRPVPETHRMLAELTRAHLVAEHSPGRYLRHDLLRAYAAELADAIDSDDDRRTARSRVLDHYLHAIHAADRWLPDARDQATPPPVPEGVVAETFASNTEARTWLTNELPVLLAVIADARNDGFDHHIQQMCRLLVTFLHWRGLWHHQLTVQQAALPAADRQGDLVGQADIHRSLAHASFHLGQRKAARAYLEQALVLYQEAGDDPGHLRAQLYLVWMADQEGRPTDALRYARQLLDAAREASHPVLHAVAYNAIGWCHTLLGDHERAIVHCEQALAELAEVGELAYMADAWDSLGHAHLKLGRHPQAIEYYRRAVERCREFGNHQQEAAKLSHLGVAHQAAGDLDAARQSWQRALRIFDETGHPEAEKLRARIAAP